MGLNSFPIISVNSSVLLAVLGVWENPGGGGGIFCSEISHSACASIFDMLHSFAPRYSRPSIRHLQPSLMPGLCKSGQKRRGLHSHTDISQEVQMSGETGKHEKFIRA